MRVQQYSILISVRSSGRIFTGLYIINRGPCVQCLKQQSDQDFRSDSSFVHKEESQHYSFY